MAWGRYFVSTAALIAAVAGSTWAADQPGRDFDYLSTIPAGKNASLKVVERMLRNVASIWNGQLPVEFDEMVRWDSVRAGPGKRLNEDMTIKGITPAEVREAGVRGRERLE